MNRIESGIEGFDCLFDGGIPRGSNVLIFGKAGSGKTLLSLELLIKGVSLYNESGVFVSFDQTEDELMLQSSQFGWNLKKYVKAGKIIILSFKMEDVNRDFVNNIIFAVKKINAKRLIIDNLALLSLSPLFGYDNKKFSFVYKEKLKLATNPKQLIYNVVSVFKSLPTTNFYLTVPAKEDDLTVDGISEYICDGVLKLGVRSLGKSFLRTIEAKKMRRSNIRAGINSFKITPTGIKIDCACKN
jgi:circadian clock protein KaiC